MSAHEVVPAALDGERIDRLVAMITSASRAQVVDWIDAGLVQRNGSVVSTRSQRVHEGDRIDIDIDLDAPLAALIPEPDVELTIVHVDDDVIVIDKQAGLVVHPGAGNATGTLVQGLLARFPEIAEVGDPERPGIVHRLDKDTSGLMLVARTQEAYEELVAMLAAHEIERCYLTLVWGIPESVGGLAGPTRLPPGDRHDVGEGYGLEVATHVFADVGPDGEQHALALVVAGAVRMGLPEVTGHDRSVDGAHDRGEADGLR